MRIFYSQNFEHYDIEIRKTMKDFLKTKTDIKILQNIYV